MADPSELSLRKKILFSLIPVLSLLLVLEGGLRLVGFQSRTMLEAMTFTFPLEEWRSSQGIDFLERDPVLFWKPKPHIAGHNSRGLLGPEFAVPKPPGIFRIVCLGDSCTHFGPRPYPRRFQEILEHRAPGRFDVINAGVLGWSSHQGLMRLRTDVPEWQPDLVTVYFGWNDHWLARGFRDREQPIDPPWLVRVNQGLGRLRFYQLLMRVTRPPVSESGARPRVEPAEYAENLRQMKRECDRLGAEVWFLTSPHALDLGIPAFLVDSGEVIDPESTVELHRSYNAIVRRVGAELGVKVVDLAREIDGMDKQTLFDRDHIHLSDAGRTLVAAMLFARMLDGGYLPEG